jgi:hypothetical protein
MREVKSTSEIHAAGDVDDLPVSLSSLFTFGNKFTDACCIKTRVGPSVDVATNRIFSPPSRN